MGLEPRIEDVQWLRLLDLNVRGEVPQFNRSRLIAMGLIDRRGEVILLTEKGRKLLAANPRLPGQLNTSEPLRAR